MSRVHDSGNWGVENTVRFSLQSHPAVTELVGFAAVSTTSGGPPRGAAHRPWAAASGSSGDHEEPPCHGGPRGPQCCHGVPLSRWQGRRRTRPTDTVAAGRAAETGNFRLEGVRRHAARPRGLRQAGRHVYGAGNGQRAPRSQDAPQLAFKELSAPHPVPLPAPSGASSPPSLPRCSSARPFLPTYFADALSLVVLFLLLSCVWYFPLRALMHPPYSHVPSSCSRAHPPPLPPNTSCRTTMAPRRFRPFVRT